MPQINFVILYVTDMQLSRKFYSELLDSTPKESSPTFTSFELQPGMHLGLWLKSGVKPTVNAPAGAMEITYCVRERQEVDALYRQWQEKGLELLQHPDGSSAFDYACMIQDPDGHRIRAIAPDA